MLNDYDSENTISTILAGDEEIILMVSVADSEGAIVNDTIAIRVTNFCELFLANLNK